MECEADIKGVKGILPPSEDWQTIHRGIVERPFEIEITLPDGSTTKKYTGVIESRWVHGEDHLDLQLLNRESVSIPFFVRWYIPASERLCCYDYGRNV